MKKTCTLVLLLSFAAPGFSQNKADTAKEIINYGLAVYAKDANSFQEAERRTLDSLITNSDNVSSTSQFLKSKGGQLKNVAANMDEWLKLIDAANGADRYNTVVNKISETLKKPHSTDANILKWRAENVDAIFTKPALGFVNAPANGEPITEENSTEKTPTNPNPATMNSTAVSNSNTLLWIAFILALASTIGVAALVLMLRNKLENYRSFKARYKDEIARLWQAIDMLKKDQPAATNVPAQATGSPLLKLEERLTQLEKNWKEVETQQRSKIAVAPAATTPQPQPKKVMVEKPAIPTNTYYAKLADMENGFSEQILSNEQNGEQIYEIITKGNKGRFIITNSTGAQKYALSDYRYYLERACSFLNEPTPNCRIDTKEEGELIQNGANWTIQKKAIIQFV